MVHSTLPSTVCVLLVDPAGMLSVHNQYGARPLAADGQGHFFTTSNNSSWEGRPEASGGKAPSGHKQFAPQLLAAFAHQTARVSTVQLL